MKQIYDEHTVNITEGETNVMKIMEEVTSADGLEDPLYIFDIGDIVKKHKTWIEKMPRVIPHYAVKCNDNEIVLATLAALGTSFDCASKSEVNKILELGVSPDRIIFANPTKPNSHIRHASATNVTTMTFDCDIELQKIKTYCPEAKLVLRIRCEAEHAQCPLGKKFGCDPITEAPRLLKIAASMGLDIIGISFHVGSGCKDYPIYYKAIGICKDLFEQAENLGFQMTLLDIGGGFPGDKGKTIDEVAGIVNQALDQFFPDKRVRVIAEPGRFYVASAFTLVTCVHSKKNIYNQHGDVEHVMYYINDGVYCSFNCLLYDHQVVVPQLMTAPLSNKTMSSTIWGPTCDALDQIIEKISLPDINIGDIMYFENMGAYTIPVASPFNGFPLPKVHACISKDIWEMLKSLLPLDEEYFIKLLAGNSMISKVFERAVYA